MVENVILKMKIKKTLRYLTIVNIIISVIIMNVITDLLMGVVIKLFIHTTNTVLIIDIMVKVLKRQKLKENQINQHNIIKS